MRLKWIDALHDETARLRVAGRTYRRKQADMRARADAATTLDAQECWLERAALWGQLASEHERLAQRLQDIADQATTPGASDDGARLVDEIALVEGAP